MSETPSLGAISRNVGITVASRAAQLVGIPIGLWLLYSAGSSLEVLKADVATLKATMSARIEMAEVRDRLQEERISALERRMETRPIR